MKILEVIPYYPPYVGGQERYIYNLCKYLGRLGHEVTVATSDYMQSPGDKDPGLARMKYYHCLARPLRNPITPGMIDLKKEAKAYDIIHTHNEHSFAAMMAAHIRASSDKPLVLTCHGQLRFGEALADAFERFYSRSIGPIVLGRCDAICVNSALDKEYIGAINPGIKDNIRLVNNAIDTEYLGSLKPDATLGDRLDGIAGPVRLLFVGRIVKRKGIYWLIKAMKLLIDTEKRGDVTLLLAGEGDDKDYFLRMVKSLGLERHVVFLGNVSDPELSYLYATSNMLILPTLSDVCPTVVLEAMYYGLPVISTSIPGVVDHFKDAAILVEGQNEKALASAMIRLIDDKALAKKLSASGKEKVIQEYTWERVAKKYAYIYEEAIGSIV